MTDSIGNSGLFTSVEFKNRGVIKLAPDVLVYIGGNLQETVIAPVSIGNGKMNFNDGITSVSIQNNVDPPGSSTASIEIATPIYSEKSNYWMPFKLPDGSVMRMPILVAMMEVRIYLKGRFLVREQPQYYPAFWGIITNIEENYSGGLYKMTVQCADMLHWWSYATITVFPTPASSTFLGGGQDVSWYSTIFHDANPFTIIHSLFRMTGMNNFVAPTWLAQMPTMEQIYPQKQLLKATSGIMKYWETRFKNLGGLLKMYGIRGDQRDENGNAVIRDGSRIKVIPPATTITDPSDVNAPSQANTRAHGNQQFTINDSLLKGFPVFFQFHQIKSFDSAETNTKLEIATEVKTRCDYEFFQDVNGNFIFKPPFYNMNVKGVQPYEIETYDIINASFSHDTEGMVTVLQLNTAFDIHMRETSFAKGVGFHMDIDLMQRFGVRFRTVNVEYITDPGLASQLAVAHMSMINAHTYIGSVTIPGRPEIRLGYPVYIPHRDSFHYVKSINHSFDYGSSFTTTLSLTAERRRMFQLTDQGTWGSAPMRNYIMKFTGKVQPSVTNPDADIPTKINESNPLGMKQKEMLMTENRFSSMANGLYAVVAGPPGDDQNLWAITHHTAPYTDVDGYRVIGAFPYGRGLNALNISGAVAHAFAVEKSNITVTNIKAGSLAESAKMDEVFFFNQNPPAEGTVPAYLLQTRINVGDALDSPGPVPSSQGITTDIASVSTQPATLNAQNRPSSGEKITNMVPSGSDSKTDSNVLV
jgi:hypothetical protein